MTSSKGNGFKFKWQRAFMQSDLSPLTKLILHTLCAYMREDGTHCYPSIETLSRMTGLTTRSVRPHLQGAVEQGWITRWSRIHGGESLAGREAQGWRRYQYAATIPPEGGEQDSPRCPEGGEDGAWKVGNGVPPNNQENNQKKKTERETETEQQTARPAASPPPLTLFLVQELPETLSRFLMWIDAAKAKEMWEALETHLEKQGNYQGENDPGIVDLEREYASFIVHHQGKADEGQGKTWSPKTWHGQFKRWLSLAWDHAMKSPALRDQANHNLDRAEAEARKRAEAEARASQARQRAEAEARKAEGKVCAHCRNMGEPLGNERYHCIAGCGRPSAAMGLHPGDSRFSSTVFATESRSCDRWEARS